MIKFFRKIRQKLISENKFSKYLMYAIGEIILIVIGILIALSIDNWNEQNKKEALELKLLKEVADAIEFDIKGLPVSIKYLEEDRVSAKKLKEHLLSDLPYSDTVALQFASITLGGVYIPDFTSFESLKDAGINSIRNDEIRKSLPNYYKTYTTIEGLNNSFSVRNYWRRNIYPKYFKTFDYSNGAIPKDFENIKEQEEIYIAIDYILNDNRYYISQLENQLEKAKQLDAIIKEELNRRKKRKHNK